MHQNQQKISARTLMVCWLVMVNVVVLRQGFVSHPAWYKAAWFTLPLLLLACLLTKRTS